MPNRIQETLFEKYRSFLSARVWTGEPQPDLPLSLEVCEWERVVIWGVQSPSPSAQASPQTKPHKDLGLKGIIHPCLALCSHLKNEIEWGQNWSNVYGLAPWEAYPQENIAPTIVLGSAKAQYAFSAGRKCICSEISVWPDFWAPGHHQAV